MVVVSIVGMLTAVLPMHFLDGIAADEEVIFPDENLEAEIRRMLFGLEDTDPICASDLELFTTIFIPQEGDIESLEGLQYCVNLEIIFIQDNNISDISPLADLTNIETLSLS